MKKKALEEYLAKREKRKSNMANFFFKVKQNYPAAKEKYDGLCRDRPNKNGDRYNEIDGLYRAYHSTYKMYNELQNYIGDCLSVVFSLFGKKFDRNEPFKIEDIFEEMKKNDMDSDLIKIVRQALNLRCNSDDNDEKWFAHQKTLTSAAYHVKIGLESIMYIAENYYKKNKLIAECGFLDKKEALCMYLLSFDWSCQPDEVRKKIKNKMDELEGKNRETFKWGNDIRYWCHRVPEAVAGIVCQKEKCLGNECVNYNWEFPKDKKLEKKINNVNRAK